MFLLSVTHVRLLVGLSVGWSVGLSYFPMGAIIGTYIDLNNKFEALNNQYKSNHHLSAYFDICKTYKKLFVNLIPSKKNSFLPKKFVK